MFSHNKRYSGCHQKSNHRTLFSIDRNCYPKCNPWYEHCHHGWIFLYLHTLWCFFCLFDCRCTSKKFIPVYHQGKITCHRIHLLSQCLCATYLASGNSRPYRKRRIYACSRGKALVSNHLTTFIIKLYLICMLQIGIAYLKHAFLSVIGILIV